MESAACAAGYSLYHFCRLFALAVGIPPGEYVRKRRLSEAARELAETRKPVGNIAREFGFQSHEAFTRSFRALFGVPPERYRRETEPARLMKPFVLMEDLRLTDPAHLAASPEVVALPGTTVAGLRFLCDLRSPDLSGDITAHWERSSPLLRAAGAGEYPEKRYGIGWPAEGREADPVLEYLAGREWQPRSGLPPGFSSFCIPEGWYLRAVHRGSPRLERETFLYLYGAFLPGSGLRVRGAFDFDVYTERFRSDRPDDPDSEVEIYIPVEPSGNPSTE